MKKFSFIDFSEKNAPLVLRWRNSQRVRTNMLDDSVISEESHRIFLRNLNQDLSKAYFIVAMDKKPVGCIYFTDLDTSTVTWGCYIGEEKPIPGLFIAFLLLAANFAFSKQQVKVLRSEVAYNNQSPIKLNKFLGIPEIKRTERVTTSGERKNFIEYELNKNDFDSVHKKSLKVLPSSIRMLIDKSALE